MLKVNAKINDRFCDVLINLDVIDIVFIIEDAILDRRTIEYTYPGSSEIKHLIVTNTMNELEDKIIMG